MKKLEKSQKQKIIIEIILIPLCFLYLSYTLLNNHPKASLITCSILVIITSILFAIKYFREVYIYKHKYNFFKILYAIFSTILIINTILNLLIKNEYLFIIFLIQTIILLGYLLFFSTKKLLNIKKDKGYISKNAFPAFLSLVSFAIILVGLLIII